MNNLSAKNDNKSRINSGYAQICVCMTKIYVVCLVAMSKFESFIAWIYVVF